MIQKKENITNFDTLLKNLKEYPDLYQFVYKIAIEGLITPYNGNDSTISLGVLHGIFRKSDNGNLVIHNRIYKELVADTHLDSF